MEKTWINEYGETLTLKIEEAEKFAPLRVSLLHSDMDADWHPILWRVNGLMSPDVMLSMREIAWIAQTIVEYQDAALELLLTSSASVN